MGLPSPTRVQVHRVPDPERAEHEHVVPAGDRLACGIARVLRFAGSARQLRPLAAHREDIARGVVAEHARVTGRKLSRTERRRPIGFNQAAGRGAGDLRHVDLLFEFDDARELRGGQPAFELKVLLRSVLRLHRERRRARVGHQIHARRPAGGGIGGRWQTALGDERTDAEVLMSRVLRVRDRTRAAEHRDRGVRACEAVGCDAYCSRSDRARPRW